MRIKRFSSQEMKGWPTSDANLILIFEILLMSAFLMMNASDLALQAMEQEKYHETGDFLISGMIAPYLSTTDPSILMNLERFCWWFHILGIFGFLNYLVISKHLHIIFAFPNSKDECAHIGAEFKNTREKRGQFRSVWF